MTSGPSEHCRMVSDFHTGAHGRIGFDLLFDALDDEVVWWVAGPTPTFPWAGEFRGVEGVKRWRDELQGALAYERFEQLEVFGAGDAVVERVDAGGTARSTGKAFSSEVVRLWRIVEGRVVEVRSYYDTAAYLDAVTPG